MDLNVIVRQVNRHIRVAVTVIKEIFLNYMALVASKNDKVVIAVMAVNFHYVPKNRVSAYVNHRFWNLASFFT